MGTREVYEEKLRRGNLEFDPTYKPGLGEPRCPRCLALLNPTKEKSEWELAAVMKDVSTVVGAGLGGWLSALYNLDKGIPYFQKHVKGPKWRPLAVGLPPLILFCAASAAFGGYALPRFAQLTVTSYHAASSAAHYHISLLTRRIEEDHIARIRDKQLK